MKYGKEAKNPVRPRIGLRRDAKENGCVEQYCTRPGDQLRKPTKNYKYVERSQTCSLNASSCRNVGRLQGLKVAVIFEGPRRREEKAGVIKRITQSLNPASAASCTRHADKCERGQWYFQRYIARFRRGAKSFVPIACTTAPGFEASEFAMSELSGVPSFLSNFRRDVWCARESIS